jgi:pimeloyl-ACP methyl ester carboxylesterase
MMVKKFTINIPKARLNTLRERLEAAQFPTAPERASWSYGTDLEYMKGLVKYWRQTFDWRAVEEELNKFSHFTAQVKGTNLHFIHQRNSDIRATPLMLIHGWPDSFYRFYKVIPLLAEKFHVVVPSLPGFGFSEKVAMNSGLTADLLAALMHEELGYERFAVSSGDIGTPIVQALANRHKELISIAHLTDVGYPMGSDDFSTMTPEEQAFAGKCQQWWYTEAAYNMLQSTKPQTLAFALTDSPMGLASWMVEKFQAWSDGGIEKAFTKNEILTNISLYYLTDTIASSIRTYAENTRALYASGMPKPPAKIEVPTAIASFPSEMVPVVKDWAKRKANVVRFTNMTKGGHFAALEVPELFAKDLAESIAELQP